MISNLSTKALADPTLQSCPHDDVYEDAAKAAEGNGPRPRSPGRGQRMALVRKLLTAAAPYWKTARYSSAHYDKKKRAKMCNRPTDVVALRKALDSVVFTPDEEQALASTRADQGKGKGKGSKSGGRNKQRGKKGKGKGKGKGKADQ